MRRPTALGDLRRAVRRLASSAIAVSSVSSVTNLIEKIRAGKRLFPGIIGYDESVIPQIINAILSQHNFVILGLRGQAKTRILRALVDLLDDKLPVVPGCEINDDPLAPPVWHVSDACSRGRRRAAGCLATSGASLRRKAGDARRHDRRHDRRHRPDQGGTRWVAALGRAHHPLRVAPTRQ